VDIDLARSEFDPFAISADHAIERVTRRRCVKKNGHRPVGGRVGERVVRRYLRHLCRGPNEDAHRLAGVILETGLQQHLDLRLRLSAAEDHIAAGDIGLHVGESGLRTERPQIPHRQFPGAPDIHRAQQGNERRHWNSLGGLPRQSSI
jgi:hypothetical protein